MTDSSRVGPHVTGVLLGAGRGRRMGSTKQLLPWPPGSEGGQPWSTVIESAFDAIATFCQDMIVVLGHESDAVRAALGRRACEVHIGDPDAEMIESIKIGLRAAIMDDRTSCVLLHPADHPEVKSSTIRAMLAAHHDQPDCVIMPEHEGRGGHPVLIPHALVEDILAFTGSGGLRAFWTLHPEQCLRLEVDDPLSVNDLDTPEAYQSRGE